MRSYWCIQTLETVLLILPWSAGGAISACCCDWSGGGDVITGRAASGSGLFSMWPVFPIPMPSLRWRDASDDAAWSSSSVPSWKLSAAIFTTSTELSSLVLLRVKQEGGPQCCWPHTISSEMPSWLTDQMVEVRRSWLLSVANVVQGPVAQPQF